MKLKSLQYDESRWGQKNFEEKKRNVFQLVQKQQIRTICMKKRVFAWRRRNESSLSQQFYYYYINFVIIIFWDNFCCFVFSREDENLF